MSFQSAPVMYQICYKGPLLRMVLLGQGFSTGGLGTLDSLMVINQVRPETAEVATNAHWQKILLLSTRPLVLIVSRREPTMQS